MIIAGASAYPRIIDFRAFREIAEESGAFLLADMAHIAGLVAAGIHPSPVGEADVITSTTHKTLRGPRGGLILAREEHGPRLNKAVFPGVQGGPLMHVVAAKAVCFLEAMDPSFTEYQRQTVANARRLAQALGEKGFDLVSGGTDNHMVLVDLTSKGLTGAQAEEVLGRAGIVANKNAVPFDRLGPRVTSGLRLGTPALTTRGMKEPEMVLVAGLIERLLAKPESKEVQERVRVSVEELCSRFPIYPEEEDKGTSRGPYGTR
jgi:glycine hydroxymethyltransferase